MKKPLIIALVITFSSCHTSKSKEDLAQNKADQNVSPPIVRTNLFENAVEGIDTTDYDHAAYFVIVADTGLNYLSLQTKMYALSRRLNIPIDTMGRYFNESKNLIALPDDDDDEMYAGDYFPRRFPSDDLSLEYLEIYHKDANDKMIALVAGIYETEAVADSSMAILKRQEPKCFKLKSELYVGCMH